MAAEFDLWTLSNGLRVIGRRMPHLRSLSVGISVHAGSLMELPEENGISHFLEHMAFKGTARRSARQIAVEMDAIGAQINAYTTTDCTCFYAKLIDEDLPQVMDVLSDIFLHAAYDPVELDKERGVVLEEIAASLESPDDIVSDLLNRAQYGDTPAGRPVLGTPELVSSFRREDLLAYRAKHYTPASTVVSLCGNYDPEALRELIETTFGGWTSETPFRSAQEETSRQGIVLTQDKEDVEQLKLCLGFPAFKSGDDRNLPLSVMNNVFGGSMSSRLFQRVREELGLVYAISSSPYNDEARGSLDLYAAVSPRNAGRVMEEIDRERRRLLAEHLTENELREVKNRIRVSTLFGLENPSSQMHFMGDSLLVLGRVRTTDERLARIEAVTLADVEEVAHQVLECKPCLSIVGPSASELGGLLA